MNEGTRRKCSNSGGHSVFFGSDNLHRLCSVNLYRIQVYVDVYVDKNQVVHETHVPQLDSHTLKLDSGELG